MNIPAKDKLIPLQKNFIDHNCFGCGPGNDAGLKMEFYTSNERNAVYSWLTVPDHMCGWQNVVHGGIVTTILDEAMGWAAFMVLKTFFLTKTLTTNFYQPVIVGQKIFVTGDVTETRGNREAELRAAIYDSNDIEAATATSVISLFPLEVAKKKQLFKGQDLKEIEKSINELSLDR